MRRVEPSGIGYEQLGWRLTRRHSIASKMAEMREWLDRKQLCPECVAATTPAAGRIIGVDFSATRSCRYSHGSSKPDAWYARMSVQGLISILRLHPGQRRGSADSVHRKFAGWQVRSTQRASLIIRTRVVGPVLRRGAEAVYYPIAFWGRSLLN